MTKEEIIIDGVNVKDCKRRIGKNSYCRYFKRPCADNNFNCIWKQHERLKEENEKLKKTLQKLEDLSLKTYDVADFQMYFDNLRGTEYEEEKESEER